jgi:8-oxo-dGTP diphosphatase
MSTKSVGVIVLGDDQNSVLLQKREDFRVWSIPAGRMEDGETREQAGIRETREETGYLVQPGQFVGEYWRPQMPRGGDVMYVYVAHVTGGNPQDRGWEAVAVDWFDVDHLPRNTVRFTREYLADLKGGNLPVKKTQVLPWWYISLLRVGFFFRNIRNHVLGRP